jgi:DNA helicase-2/ATP-dependent DNA helicase PcrA
MTHSPTPEQEAILEEGRSSSLSLMIDSLAGTGKTTTLELLTKVLPNQASLALAFNKKNAVEMTKRFPQNFTCMSFNALGHRAWGATLGQQLKLDERKLGRLCTAALAQLKKSETPEEAWDDLRRLVTLAMQQGMKPGQAGLLEDSPDSWKDLAFQLFIESSSPAIGLARGVLMDSIKEAYSGIISFDDQIYMSSMFGGSFPKFPQVIVDEYQDLNPLNIRMLQKCATGRIIAAGDSLQSIYMFRGADGDAREKILALRKEWSIKKLTLTFRCPHAVVERQQDHAPGFTAHAGNKQGSFRRWRAPKDPVEAESWKGWTWEQVPEGETFVLCRNNAPLLKLAFQLLRKRVGLNMLGRDIGKGLLALSKKILPLDDIPLSECIALVERWQAKEQADAMARNQEGKISGISDRADCLLAVLAADGVANAGHMRHVLKDLFEQDGHRVTLSTGHRAKGLERDVVLVLDPWRTPSKWAKEAGGAQLQQEMNLRYVMDTRAKEHLIYANLEDFL